MPSVATSFFLPPAGAALPGVVPAAATGFGVALANAIPAVATSPALPVATVPLPGLATPATLTVLNDIAPPREAVTPAVPTPSAPVATALPQVEVSQPTPSKPTVATGSPHDPQPAILVVSESKVSTQPIATVTEAPATPARPKFNKTLPAILVAVPVAAAPTTNAPGSEPVPARQTPTAPVLAIAASPTTPSVAAPASLDEVEAPTLPPSTPTRIADKVETPEKVARTEAPEKDAPVADPTPLIMPAPPAAAILVAAAAPIATPPAKLPTSESPATDAIADDTVTATVDAQVPSDQVPTGQHKPVSLRTQELSVTIDNARGPGLPRSQELNAASPNPAAIAAIATAMPAPAAQKADKAPDDGGKTDKLAVPSVEVAQTPDLPIVMALPQPAPPAPELAARAAPSPAPAAEAATNAPAQAVAAAAGPPLATAPEPALPAPVTDKPAHVEFASRVVVPAEARTVAANADLAPAPTTPTPPVPGPTLLTPAPLTAAAALPAPREAGTVAAEPGKIGREMGVIIARHAATGGGETITVRLDPKDMGRIDVTLSFDDDGRLRAVVAADNPAALDLLRRDSADLNRALVDAGVRADPQSLRFDTRSGGGDQAASGQSGQRRDQARSTFDDTGPADTTDDTDHRPRAARGGIDMMA